MNSEFMKLLRSFIAACCVVVVVASTVSGAYTVSESMGEFVFGESREVINVSFESDKLTLNMEEGKAFILSPAGIMQFWDAFSHIMPAGINAAVLIYKRLF